MDMMNNSNSSNSHLPLHPDASFYLPDSVSRVSSWAAENAPYTIGRDAAGSVSVESGVAEQDWGTGYGATFVSQGMYVQDGPFSEVTVASGQFPSGQASQMIRGPETDEQNRQTLPFPDRPWVDGEAGVAYPGSSDFLEPGRDVSTTIYSMEVPKTAPQLEDQSIPDTSALVSGFSADFTPPEVAEFYPWAGQHPEDRLNEQTTKTGYADKIPSHQTEMNSARPVIWPIIKHKSGVQALSSLLASVLKERQAYGSVTSTSTFKPPPRVTLTDTKREAWLKDLANCTIPLRRLSRTIPHGIRGKVLLDHCLNKWIPVVRAVWLAKCVGGNEIRAFRRKGGIGTFASGGEAKWVRDWTLNVEQFIEAVIEGCGESNWWNKMGYCVQLVYEIYSDHLLDKDHFFHWMTASLRTTSCGKSPMWLMLVQRYVGDIVIYRRRGQQLAQALLGQLDNLNPPHVAATNAKLLKHLLRLLQFLLTDHPACFVLPTCWSGYEFMMRSLFTDDALMQTRLGMLANRNARLSVSSKCLVADNKYNLRQRFVYFLDALPSTLNVGTLPEKCLSLIADHDLLVTTLCDWATTRYGHGLRRIYIAAQVLRVLGMSGVDIQWSITRLLESETLSSTADEILVCKLVSELIRSCHLSVGRYLQWLIAKGPYSDCSDTGDKVFQIRLLDHIPLHGLPQQVLNLRRVLRDPSRASELSEQEQILTVTCNLSDLLNIHLPVRAVVSETTIEICTALNGTAKYEIAIWIRNRFFPYSCKHAGGDQCRRCIANRPSLDGAAFTTLRIVLEALQDFTVFADVLGLLVDRCDHELLNNLVQTVNAHFAIFHVIGASERLFQGLLQRMDGTISRTPQEKRLLIGLIDLGLRLPGASRTVARLRQQLLMHESIPSLAGCSPASDQLVESLQSGAATFMDQVEDLILTTSSVEPALLQRILSQVVRRMEDSWKDESEYMRCAGVLAQLHRFDEEAVQKELLEWLRKIFHVTGCPPVTEVVPSLVSAGAVTLQYVFEALVIKVQEANSSSLRQALSVEVLRLLLPYPTLHPTDRVERPYRFELERKDIIDKGPLWLVDLVHSVLHPQLVQGQPPSPEACRLAALGSFSDLLQHVLMAPTMCASRLADDLLALSTVNPLVREIIEGMLTLPAPYGINTVLYAANDFNVALCQLLLRMMLVPQGSPQNSALRENQAVASGLLQVLTTSTSAPAVWRRLISGFPDDVIRLAHSLATKALLATVPDHKSGKSCGGTMVPRESLLGVIQVLEAAIPADESSNLVEHIAVKLDTLRTHVPPTESLDADTDGQARPLTRAIIYHRATPCLFCTNVLLGLLTTHIRHLGHPRFSQPTLSRLSLALVRLLLSFPVTDVASHDLALFVFDTLALISDLLTDETRTGCIAVLRDQCRIFEPRVCWLLGYKEVEDLNFFTLVTSDGAGSDGAAGETGTRGVSEEDGNGTVASGLRTWDMLHDATPVVGENDTSLSLRLFGARKSTL